MNVLVKYALKVLQALKIADLLAYLGRLHPSQQVYLVFPKIGQRLCPLPVLMRFAEIDAPRALYFHLYLLLFVAVPTVKTSELLGRPQLMQTVHSFRAFDCLKAAERRSDVRQIGQILKIIVFFRYESADEIDACEGLIVANPNECDQSILMFG